MSYDNEEFDIRRYFRVLARRWRVLVIAGLVGALAGTVWTMRQPKLYSSSAKVRLVEGASETAFSRNDIRLTNPFSAARELDTEAEIVQSDPIRARAAEALGKDASSVYSVSVKAINDSDVLQISVRTRDQAVAKKAATAIVEAYIAARQEESTAILKDSASGITAQIETINAKVAELDQEILDLAESQTDENPQITELMTGSLIAERTSLLDRARELQAYADQAEVDAELVTGGVRVVDSATTPGGSDSRGLYRNIGIGITMGLILAIGLVLLVDIFDETIHDENELESLVRPLPVLGRLPAGGRASDTVLTHGPTLEAYRAISTTLAVVAERESMRALTLVSADDIDHNAGIAANVAMESAESGTSTMVVDADLRSPRLSKALGVSVQQSLSSFLDGSEGPDDLIHKQDVGNDKSLFVVPQGRSVADPTPLLSAPKFRSLIQRLRDRFALVLIEAPALSEGSDGLLLCDVADGVVLIVQVGTTRRDHLERARQQLGLLGTPVVGVIINESTASDASAAYVNA
ncbi:MAG: hypothetical protein KDB86_12330 [Actinobacteria bacterium]|nr:hypothetical protein [Actinomycetota bacterium]